MGKIFPEVGEMTEKTPVGGRCLLLISHLGPHRCLVTSCVHVSCTRLIYDVDSRTCGSVVKSEANLVEFQSACTVVTLQWIVAVQFLV